MTYTTHAATHGSTQYCKVSGWQGEGEACKNVRTVTDKNEYFARELITIHYQYSLQGLIG